MADKNTFSTEEKPKVAIKSYEALVQEQPELGDAVPLKDFLNQTLIFWGVTFSESPRFGTIAFVRVSQDVDEKPVDARTTSSVVVRKLQKLAKANAFPVRAALMPEQNFYTLK